MSINIADNINYKGPKPDFERQQYASYEEMKNVLDSRMPRLYLAYCLEDEKVYLYNKDNAIDSVTGKFRVFPENDSNNIQKEVMPAASSLLVGKIYQYVGETNQNFIKGFFYECVLDSGSGIYYWDGIDISEPDSISNYEIDILFQSQQGE